MSKITRTRSARWLTAAGTAAMSSVTLFAGVAAAGGPPIPDLPLENATPIISINDVTKAEGTGGVTNFTFTLSLSKSSSEQVKAKVSTTAGTALAGSDWQAGDLVVGFAPGLTTRQYVVSVAGDDVAEPAETFAVSLSNISGAGAGDVQGAGTILNDDAPKDLAQPEDDQIGPDDLAQPEGDDDKGGPDGFAQPDGDGAGPEDGATPDGTPAAGSPGDGDLALEQVSDAKDHLGDHRPPRSLADGTAAEASRAAAEDGDGAPVALAGLGTLGALVLLAGLVRNRRRRDG